MQKSRKCEKQVKLKAVHSVLMNFGLSGDSGMDNLKAAVARIFNKETHEISGAAVSPSEWSLNCSANSRCIRS